MLFSSHAERRNVKLLNDYLRDRLIELNLIPSDSDPHYRNYVSSRGYKSRLWNEGGPDAGPDAEIMVIVGDHFERRKERVDDHQMMMMIPGRPHTVHSRQTKWTWLQSWSSSSTTIPIVMSNHHDGELPVRWRKSRVGERIKLFLFFKKVKRYFLCFNLRMIWVQSRDDLRAQRVRCHHPVMG